MVIPLLTAALIVTQDFHAYFGRPQKFLTLGYFLIGVAGISCFWLGVYLGSKVRIGSTHTVASVETEVQAYHGKLLLASRAILVLTLAAYAIFLWPVAANPSLLINLLTGDPGAQYISLDARETVRIPGITSFAQLGIVYVILFMIRVLCISASRSRWSSGSHSRC